MAGGVAQVASTRPLVQTLVLPKQKPRNPESSVHLTIHSAGLLALSLLESVLHFCVFV
jgi:hypothetical protein